MNFFGGSYIRSCDCNVRIYSVREISCRTKFPRNRHESMEARLNVPEYFAVD